MVELLRLFEEWFSTCQSASWKLEKFTSEKIYFLLEEELEGY
jgi:hypothetical protein